MHTFETKVGDLCIRFNHNSDLSGDVEISRKVGNGYGYAYFSIPGEALKEFMAYWVREQKHSRLDDLTASQVLGLRDIS